MYTKYSNLYEFEIYKFENIYYIKNIIIPSSLIHFVKKWSTYI